MNKHMKEKWTHEMKRIKKINKENQKWMNKNNNNNNKWVIEKDKFMKR